MRVANVSLAAIVLGAAVILLPPLLRRAVTLSWLGTLVPLFIFLVPSTNPSSWVLIGVGTYWAWLLMFLTESSRPRTYLAGSFALLSALVAGGARSDGAAYIGLSTVVVAIVTLRDRRALTSARLLLPAVILAAMAYVYLTSGQSAALGGFAATAPGRTGWALLQGNIYNLPNLLLGVFGLGWGLGWLDTIPLPAVGALCFAAAGALVVQSAGAMWLRKGVAVALIFLALVSIPLYTLQGGGNSVGENVQPRYLLPLVTVLLGLCMLAEKLPRRTWHVSIPGLVLLVIAVSYANALALHTNIQRYVTGLDNGSLNLNFGQEWWWRIRLSPMDMWVLGSVAGVALFTALAWSSFIRPATTEPEPDSTTAVAE